MKKSFHEVRDPVHGFIRFNELERRLIDSRPAQRLKEIHQLAMTYQVYPGASHRRFEHALGVMDLAGRAFDALLRPEALEFGAESLPEATDDAAREYWGQALRAAALLHDVGHLPFSHAAERELLPPGWTHEHLTRDVILGSELAEILASSDPPVKAEDVAKLSLAPESQPGVQLTHWEAILNQVLTGPTFGVDRMDYLLRDSYHAGVGYGRFDPLRLIDSLVIVPHPARAPDAGATPAPEQLAPGIRHSGLPGVEALLLARYFMYTQVYYHPVRRAYDVHLADFMKAWLPGGLYPTGVEEHLGLTDSEVLAGIREAARDPARAGHHAARRIEQRDHFRLAYTVRRADLDPESGGHPDAPERLRAALASRFGGGSVRVVSGLPAADRIEMPILFGDGQVGNGLAESDVLQQLPPAWYGFVLCDREVVEEVTRFISTC